uniref:alpha-tubulin N-acetyltransferase 1 isoform X2 n=1 Tax=Myxine glutinosa TaxID=7769 RepID=UPI00358EC44C
MEFPFKVNYVLENVFSTLTAFGRPGLKWSEELETIVDEMGNASAKAQNLTCAVTSVARLMASKHTLYILKDTSDYGGKGSVIGFLKVGRKTLFILDEKGDHKELEPLCVLDFYVHESQQRQGHGRRLFQHMLQEQRMLPKHLAIDRPSSKFLSFLWQHYGLHKTIPQTNNFVVFEGFFHEQPASMQDERRHRRSWITTGNGEGPCKRLPSTAHSSLSVGARLGIPSERKSHESPRLLPHNFPGANAATSSMPQHVGQSPCQLSEDRLPRQLQSTRQRTWSQPSWFCHDNGEGDKRHLSTKFHQTAVKQEKDSTNDITKFKSKNSITITCTEHKNSKTLSTTDGKEHEEDEGLERKAKINVILPDDRCEANPSKHNKIPITAVTAVTPEAGQEIGEMVAKAKNDMNQASTNIGNFVHTFNQPCDETVSQSVTDLCTSPSELPASLDVTVLPNKSPLTSAQREGSQSEFAQSAEARTLARKPGGSHNVRFRDTRPW